MDPYGSDDSYHYPTQLLLLLQECLPLLCPRKKDLFLFFRAAGVSPGHYSDWESRWRADPKSAGKYEVVADVLSRLNEDRSNNALRQRREIIKRVTGWEQFSTLWPDDQLKARGLVAQIRENVNVADSFTRMKQVREREERGRREEKARQAEEQREKRRRREEIRKNLGAMFSEANHQRRGKALEAELNRLFATFGISVRESFVVKGSAGEGIVAQVDGAIVLDGNFYLVEMKWLKDKVGPEHLAQHLVRVQHRSEAARGIFISATEFTPAARGTLTDALAHRTHIGVELREIIFALERESDLKELLLEKVKAAVIDRDPFRYQW